MSNNRKGRKGVKEKGNNIDLVREQQIKALLCDNVLIFQSIFFACAPDVKTKIPCHGNT
jgi:hypothetical protein